MRANTVTPAAPAKRPSPKRKAAARKAAAAPGSGEEAPKKIRRSRREPPTVQATGADAGKSSQVDGEADKSREIPAALVTGEAAVKSPQEAAPKAEPPGKASTNQAMGGAVKKSPQAAGSESGKLFIAREGVAFGPYTEVQVREAVKLGIFDPEDLALAGDSQEWMEYRLLPAKEKPTTTTPDEPIELTLPPPRKKEWREVSAILPRLPRTAAAPPPEKASVRAPLSGEQLQEHASLGGYSAAASFVTELTRGRLAFAAVPVVLLITGLLTMASVAKHREAAAYATAAAQSASKGPATQAMARTNPITPVSLPMNGDGRVAHR